MTSPKENENNRAYLTKRGVGALNDLLDQIATGELKTGMQIPSYDDIRDILVP
jgi:hypothetical protein